MANSLWGDDFVIPEVVSTKKRTQQILDEIENPKEVTVQRRLKAKNVPIEEKIRLIEENVHRILGVYENNTVCLTTEEQLAEYIDRAIENGVIAVDTETNNSLDPLTCKLMGLCIYTPGQKNAYVPVNHVNPESRQLLIHQLTEEQIGRQLARLNQTKIIMHHGKFDFQVIKCTCGCELKIYWDTMIGTRLLDENEKSAGLKQQYISKIDPSIEKYDIEHLFEGLEYAIFAPELFALYAATDAFMTYKLYEWQYAQFCKVGNEKLLALMLEVEMPVVEVAAYMELTGVKIDKEYASLLSKKYHDKQAKVEQEINDELVRLKPIIDKWRDTPEANWKSYTTGDGTMKYLSDNDPVAVRCIQLGLKTGKSKAEQLQNPPSTTSPIQLGILLYDVMGVPTKFDKKAGKESRSTGEADLKEIDNPNCKHLCELILEQREMIKLINTYIDKLPNCVNIDGRLHAHFNQLGTDTGRFSSTDPNLQNIPSHNNEIRMMFVPSDGNVMIGSDFSQQEPRLLSHCSQDPNMIGAYVNKKDLYATMGVGVYNNDYWDNMEHHEDGSPNPEGKKRRKSMKVLYLGISYGMGAANIAEKIGCTKDEAQDILDNFYKGFPKVKGWKESVESFAKEHGYVEDVWGRRRRLPDLFLPKYEITIRGSKSTDFNPLLGSLGKVSKQQDPRIQKYSEALKQAKGYKDIEKIKIQASKDGVVIIDHGAHISQAERQCVNAVIQGSAATMSKRAMIAVHNDPELRKLGFKLLIAVHDELIGEAPKENAEAAGERLSYLMRTSALPIVQVPMKCDCEITSRWYIDDYSSIIQSEYSKLKATMSPEEAKQKIYEEHPEATALDEKEVFGE